MLTCESCQSQLLDHLYGLLDPDEVTRLEQHLATCANCATKRGEVTRWQGLLASAAKGEFPTATFQPPAEKPEPSPNTSPKQPASSVETQQPVEIQQPARPTIHSVVSRWIVAASLFLAVTAFCGPALQDLVAHGWYKSSIDREMAMITQLNKDAEDLNAQIAVARKQEQERLAQAQAKLDELTNKWMEAEQVAIRTKAKRPFEVEISGPTTALVGAPNDYRLQVRDKNNRKKSVHVEAKVQDKDNSVLYTESFDESDKVIKLPASMWAKAKPGANLTLHISATDKASGQVATVTETVRLQDPVYTTFLTTDKPMYRPGETVYYRSLTLDRATFLPANQDVNLLFELVAPSGQVVPSSNLVGLAKPVNTAGDPYFGPDGKPIRGIGTGSFALPPSLDGGEYRVQVYELAVNEFVKRPGSQPLAERKFLVNKYTPSRLQKTLEFDGKTYGPGDSVQAKIEVRQQSKPIPGATLDIVVTALVGGQPRPVKLDVNATTTDKNGNAAVKFTLPSGEVNDATLTVTVRDAGVTETLVRTVPLASRKLDIEFFPEGGDLVLGVPCKVYFRATTNTGKPADVQAVLTDGTTKLADVKTLTDAEHPGVNQGLGSFTFTPQAGKSYFLKLNKPVGIIPPAEQGYKLPDVKPNGVMLTVVDGVIKPGDKLRLQVGTSGPKRNIVVGVYTRGRALAHQKAIIEPGQITSLIMDLGASQIGGVTRVTVFEELAEGDEGRTTLLPLAERLIFRAPSQVLKLGFNAMTRNTIEPKAGPFVPGGSVDLSIRAYDEAGRPKSAILWAAVVNESVINMADEKTARTLPTHFLLSGEVQKPDELEHADFLLTDHPKAATSLDLVLGTQGWRRFAEQTPDSFRKRVPAEDADRLLIVMGAKSPTPLGWKTEVRRVFDDYWPRYETVALEVEAHEKALNTKAYENEFGPRRSDIVTSTFAHKAKLQDAGQGYYFFSDSIENRQAWSVITVPFLLSCSLVCALLWLMRKEHAAERRVWRIGTLGFLVLTLFMLFTVFITADGNREWRRNVTVSSDYGVFSTIAPAGAPAPMASAPQADVPQQVKPMANEMAQPMQIQKAPGAPNALRKAGPPMGDDAKLAPMAMAPKMAMAPRPGAAAPLALPGKPGADFEMVMPGAGGGRGPGQRPRLANHMMRARGPAALLQTAMTQQQQQAIRDGKRINAEELQVWNAIEKEIPKTQPFVVREYAHTRPAPTPGVATRNDFTETLVWQPIIVTGQDGTANIGFDLSDAVNGYQVLIAGHTLDGRVGSVTGMIEVRKPFVIEPKLPQEISSTDKLDIPFVLTNNTPETQRAAVKLDLNNVKTDGAPIEFDTEVPASGGTRKLLRLLPEKTDGEVTVKATGSLGNGPTDSVERKLTIVPDGFPVEGTVTDLLEKQTTAKLALPKQWIPGTLKTTVTVYPNTLSELQAGLDGLLREPYGCFEQSSTTNYPNVLIMQYLQETNQAKPEIAKRARDLMERGYGRLTSYECPKTGTDNRIGYEWFGGKDRQHEALTAYGLLQFTDMARVYPVDPAMLKRTKEFLLNSRDGAGGFKRNSVALDSFGRAPTHITNAYIIWAITEAEKGTATPSDLSKEIEALLKLANEKEGKPARDPYFLALLANTLLNRAQQADAIPLLKSIAAMQTKDGSIPGAETSITNSQGRDLLIETTAYSVLGWIKAGRPELFVANTQNAMKWVNGQRNGGGSFGSTQSTILALKALIEFARSSKKPAESGILRVSVAGREIAKREFSNQDSGPIVVEIPNADETFKPGTADVRIETTTKENYPVAVAWSCRTVQPNSSPECAVKLDTKLARSTLIEGESVRLDVKLGNLQDKPQGMTIAIVGIPAGLKLPEDMKQLKALTDKPVDGTEPTISYWEIRGRELVIYWRGMTPKQTIQFGLDLIAEIPGEYRGPASRAYLYYNADHKHWIAPVAVTVK